VPFEIPKLTVEPPLAVPGNPAELGHVVALPDSVSVKSWPLLEEDDVLGANFETVPQLAPNLRSRVRGTVRGKSLGDLGYLGIRQRHEAMLL